MRWRNQIYVVAFEPVLQGKHMSCKSLYVHLVQALFLVILAYLVILAINAAQVAIAKKNGARTPPPREGWLLPVMGTERSYYRQSAGMAEATLAFQPINTTFSGADVAGTQPRFKSFGTALGWFCRVEHARPH